MCDLFIYQNPRECYASLCPGRIQSLCIWHLALWSNFNLLHNSYWITFPTELCLVLCTFCASLLHSFMWSIIIIIIDFFSSFSRQRYLMISHWILRDSKSPLICRSLLSILVDLNNAVVWIVFTRPLISKSSSPCTCHLVIVPRAPITTNITFIIIIIIIIIISSSSSSSSSISPSAFSYYF